MDEDYFNNDLLDIDFSEEKFYELVNKSINQDNESDIDKIEYLKNQIKNYDIYDFINSISALNLIPNNQSKSVIFNTMISTALSIPKEDINFSNKISISKFKKLVREFENLAVTRNIDPAEFPYISRIIFYKNYNLFMGVSTLSTDAIQMFLNGFRDHWNKLSRTTLNRLNTNIELMLNISTDISKSINYDYNKNKDIPYDEDIYIPSSKELEELKKKLVFPISYLAKFKFDEEEFNSLFCELNCCTNNNPLNFDEQYYFLHPILKYEDKGIILDITLFPLILMYKLVSISLTDIDRVNLVDEYVSNTVNHIRQYFELLGNYKIKEDEIPIDLIDSNNYKEFLYTTGNNGVIVNICISDNAKNFDEERLISYCDELVKIEYVEKRLKIIYDRLISTGANANNIFLIITCITLGRTINFSLPKDYKYMICLSPYELKAISINESSKNMFLQRYMIAKNRLKAPNHNAFSEINLIAQYVAKDYSFYFDDRVDSKNTMLMYVGEFSSEYIYKSEEKRNEHLIPSYEDNYNRVVIKNDDNIYFCDNHFIDRKLNLCIEANTIVIWLLTEEIKDVDILHIYKNLLDLFSYWINEYIGVFNSKTFSQDKLVIEVKLNGNKELFFQNKVDDMNIDNIVNLSNDGSKIILEIVPELIWSLNCKDNKNEKIIFIDFIKKLSKLINIDLYNDREIKEIFSNPYKKKAVALDYSKYSYLKPFNSSKERLISASDINNLLDDIGLFVKNDLKYEYGILDEKKNDELPKIIVEKLYTEICDTLRKCNKETTIKLLYYESERILASMMIQKSSYKNNIACYPNHKIDIDERFNEANKSSISIKFLIELLSSFSSTGDENLSEYELECLLAKSLHLIEWAYRNDLYHYNMMNTPMELLHSNRIGINHDELEKTNKAFSILREEQLGYYDKGKLGEIRQTFQKEKLENNALEKAFKKEFQFSIDNLFTFFEYLIEQGENNQNVEVFEKDILSIIKELSNEIPTTEIKHIIEEFSLSERENYLSPPNPFRKEDVYPWRFNRNLSFTRRPLILYKNSIIWGNRNLSNSIFFLFDLIDDGKLSCYTKEMKDYISKINNLRGKNFNNLVYEYINNIDGFIVDKNVKNINNIKIEDINKNTLGDIDVLYINLKRKKIVLVETKDFNSVKNYYEMYNEYQRMFLDVDDKKCFLTKHKARVDWVKSHIDDVIKHYGLESGNWQVTYMFITNEHCVANDTFDLKEKIYSIKELDEKLLMNMN